MARPKFEPTNEDKKIAQKYKDLRESMIKKNGKKFSYRDLAIALINEPNYAARIFEIESASAQPSIRDMKLYHDYFKVPYEYLLGETNSLNYENMVIGKDLGLSDEVINAFKLWKSESPKCNIVFVLNQIFKLGYGYSFFNVLNHYFYGECNEIQIRELNRFGMNYVKSSEISAIGNDITKVISISKSDLEYIFQHKLYDFLADIKKKLKENKFECESEMYNGFDTNACLSEHYNDLDGIINDKDFTEYLSKIRRNTNGLHSTTKTKRRQNLVHNKGSKGQR